jgi:hypothetical protein
LLETDVDDPLDPSHYLSTVPAEIYVGRKLFDKVDATRYLDTKEEGWLWSLYDRAMTGGGLFGVAGGPVYGDPPSHAKGVWLSFVPHDQRGVDTMTLLSPKASVEMGLTRRYGYLYIPFPAFKFYYQRRFREPLKTFSEI